jgi:hypothetical protein
MQAKSQKGQNKNNKDDDSERDKAPAIKEKNCLESSESDPDESQLNDPFLEESSWDTGEKETFQNPYLK